MQKNWLFYFNHKFGFFMSEFKKNKFLKNYKIVASSNGLAVWVENEKYPFFGT